MPLSYARANRLESINPREFRFSDLLRRMEAEYSTDTNPKRLMLSLYALPESEAWNALMCVIALAGIIVVSMDFVSEQTMFGWPLSEAGDLLYNVLYFVHVSAHLFNDCYSYHHERKEFSITYPIWYLLDFASYSHYATLIMPKNSANSIPYILKMSCYYARLHRPFQYLWDLNDYHLKGSVVGTLVKFWYIFVVIRVIYANFFIWVGLIKDHEYSSAPTWLKYPRGHRFVRAFFVMDTLFLPIGTDSPQTDDFGRMTTLMVMISGALLVTGTTIASMSLIIGLYMNSEEQFRSRFRLIMQEMKETQSSLRDKVETYYRMYWHKQKGVSVTDLLPKCPPTLSNDINCDIYFEAQQRSLLLRDLSYSFLSEVAKKMITINYIPGDAIIQRGDSKFAIVYISYGDVEMLTADDDETPMLRFTRGSIMNPCGGAAAVAGSKAHVSIRAATYCTAHVLKTADLWRVAAKYGRLHEQTDIMVSAFWEHFTKVKNHYNLRPHPPVKYKSTILLLKRNLMELKEARDEEGKLLLARTDIFLEIAGCYIMRNRKDASLTEESDAICLRPTFPCILQPQSSLLIVWKSFIAILTLSVVLCYPYHLVFFKTVSNSFMFYDYLLSFVFCLDIIVHLSTGAKIEEGVPTTFMQTSSQQFKSLWFVLDLLAVAPIFEFVGDGRFAGINKIIKFAKVFHLFKSLEQVMVIQANILRFISYVILMVYMCWLVASVQQGFWCFCFHHCKVTNLTHFPFWTYSDLDNGPVQERLAYSLYWAVSVMYFTVHKTNEASVISFRNCFFIMALLEILTLLHIMIEATYSATIMVTATMRDQYKMCISMVKQFLVRNNVDPILRHRFITYLHLCWYTDKAYGITHQKRSILFDLPQHVYKDISAIKRNKFILCIPFMKYVNKKHLRTVSSEAVAFYTSPNEILLNTGDMTNEIYVIHQGLCEVVDPDTKQVVSVIGSKTCFGDIECIMRIPAYYTVRAVTHVHLFSIARKFLLHPISDIPKITEALSYARRLDEYRSLVRNRREQFLFYTMPEPAPSRMFFPLPRKHEPDVKFLMPFTQLGFFSLLRYVFPRFTIRPDGPYLRRIEWFRAFCAFLSSNIFPYYTFFYLMYPNFMWYFCWLLDLFAYFDIFQRMLVGYFDEKGILVYHPASTAAHYMKGAFILDMVACLPLELLDSVRNYIYYDATCDCYMHTTTFQVLMYNRLLQLYRLPNALDILNDYMDRQDIVLVIKAMPLLLALFNVLVSLILELSLEKWVKVKGGWRLKKILDPHHGSWLDKFSGAVSYDIMESSWTLIITVYYWVMYEITTTGFNLFQPSSLPLMMVLTIGMLIGGMMVTYYSVCVISIRTNVNQTLADYQENMRDMVAYMKRERLSKDIQKEMVAHYAYQWEKMRGTDYRTILKLCDQITLRTEAILHMYGPTFAKCPILSHCDISLLRLLGRAVHSVYFKQNTVIISRGEVISHIFFLDYGSIGIREYRMRKTLSTDTIFAAIENNENEVRLKRGSVFGNLLQTITGTGVCPNEFVARSNLHVLVIDTSRFYNIIQDFPSVKVLLKKYRPNSENYVAGSQFDEVSDYSYKGHVTANRPPSISKYFHTHSKGVQIYLIIVSMLCVYGDVYNIGFQDNSNDLIMGLYILDGLFFLKIVWNYFFPYVTEEESENRTRLVSSRTRYFKTEFKYDLISMLPIELFALVYNPDIIQLSEEDDDPWLLFSTLRANRLLRVITTYKCLNRYHQKLSINLTISTIWSVFIWFILFVHCATCLWYVIGVYEDHSSPYSSWRWKPNTNESICDQQYLCSIYFVMTTFTQNGVGDILPRQLTEVLFVTALMMCSTMMYMIYVGQFSNIIQYQFFRCFCYYSEYIQLNSYLKNNRVSKNLVKFTDRYTLHLWRVSRGLQVPHFLTIAPQTLRLKVMSAAYVHHFLKHPYFRHCEPSFLRHLSEKLQSYFYEEDMYVVRACEITNAMYFIHTGKCKEIVDGEEEEDEDKAPIYNAGEHFGTEQGIYKNIPYNSSYKTVVKSQVLTLVFEDWKYLLPHFPKSRVILYRGKYKERDSSLKPESPYFDITSKLPKVSSDPELMSEFTRPKTKVKTRQEDEFDIDDIDDKKRDVKKTKGPFKDSLLDLKKAKSAKISDTERLSSFAEKETSGAPDALSKLSKLPTKSNLLDGTEGLAKKAPSKADLNAPAEDLGDITRKPAKTDVKSSDADVTPRSTLKSQPTPGLKDDTNDSVLDLPKRTAAKTSVTLAPYSPSILSVTSKIPSQRSIAADINIQAQEIFKYDPSGENRLSWHKDDSPWPLDSRKTMDQMKSDELLPLREIFSSVHQEDTDRVPKTENKVVPKSIIILPDERPSLPPEFVVRFNDKEAEALLHKEPHLSVEMRSSVPNLQREKKVDLDIKDTQSKQSTKTSGSANSEDDELFIITHDDSPDESGKSSEHESDKAGLTTTSKSTKSQSSDEISIIKHDDISTVSLLRESLKTSVSITDQSKKPSKDETSIKMEENQSAISLHREVQPAISRPDTKPQQSVLGFRDKVTTVEVPKSRISLVSHDEQAFRNSGFGILDQIQKDSQDREGSRNVKIDFSALPKRSDETPTELTSDSESQITQKESTVKLTSPQSLSSNKDTDRKLSPILQPSTSKKVKEGKKQHPHFDEDVETMELKPIKSDLISESTTELQIALEKKLKEEERLLSSGGDTTTTASSIKSVEEYMLEKKLRKLHRDSAQEKKQYLEQQRKLSKEQERKQSKEQERKDSKEPDKK